MALTDLEIRKVQPGTVLMKLSDGGGLQLWVMPDGAKRWRLAYRHNGKQKTLALGVYPAVSLREAREARDDAKRLLGAGQDPSLARKLEKAAKAKSSANTFDALADELLEKKRAEGKAQATYGKVAWLLGLARVELGTRPIAEISAPEVLRVLKAVEVRGRLETAKRLRATIGQVFRFAVATGRADSDPTGALRGAIASPVVQHRAAIVEPRAFGGLLRVITGYEGAPETQAALELLALTFARPGEVRAAEWSEFDLDGAIWSIPAAKMKMRRPHRIPLAPRVVTLLRKLHSLTGNGRFVFPSNRSRERCMSENTINAALRRLGFTKDEMTAHGFRSAASSMLNECGLWNADAIERQLAHVDNDSVRRAYARADYWEERVRMMDWWATRCAELQAGGIVIPLRAS
ncbi:integrase arm-type DNA-binding domain-containing protein [Bradyrhizobium sp. STM 3809]|uniref:tyrosine-type recombinase/integrase n=1 Tax=Bradyrhizobium sp. STM 3809 TaxID=551936 RepID=UPI0002407631|nr:integrase arm-type DNA-binding domain-containing protein [Bradyrhizobium sp. STM 3809]CCD98318.1 putative integrase; KpLE2 phage-like element [Bradyrhizobium sp. STM 3809]